MLKPPVPVLKKPGVVIHTCNSSLVGDGDREDPWNFAGDRLYLNFSEEPCLKGIWEKVMDRDI